MNSNNERKTQNKSYMEVITLSEKIHYMCVIIMVITTIACCVDFILTVPYIKDIIAMYNYLNDFQVILTLSGKFFIYIALILIEWFLFKIANMINILATTVFKNDDK
ncbi:MAG: hypothetical protein UHK60_01210 [Acutalibacteraceae bacterium]|nr:hypothetical protein [Acutalibacteraceae bacterium]